MLAYFDLSDTERTARDKPDAAMASECATHQWKLGVLRGWTPIFAQSDAIDSVPLLNIQKHPSEGASFRELVRKQRIKILLRNRKTLIEAVINDLETPRQIWSVWTPINPKLDGQKPDMEPRELIEAVRTGTKLGDDQIDSDILGSART